MCFFVEMSEKITALVYSHCYGQYHSEMYRQLHQHLVLKYMCFGEQQACLMALVRQFWWTKTM